MTNEELIDLKDAYIDNIKRYFSEEGEMFAHIAFFAEFKKVNNEELKGLFANNDFANENPSDKPAIIHVPIPNQFLETADDKDFFVDVVLKDVISDLKQKCKIKAVAWTAEAWMKTSKTIPENIDDLPVQAEVLIINIESDDVNECRIFEIERTEMSVKEDGSMETEKIELVEKISGLNTSSRGRFTGLYKAIKD